MPQSWRELKRNVLLRGKKKGSVIVAGIESLVLKSLLGRLLNPFCLFFLFFFSILISSRGDHAWFPRSFMALYVLMNRVSIS